MKVKVHSSLEPALEYNQVFDKSRFIKTFLTILGVIDILCSFRLVLGGKAVKEMPESSRLEFLEKFLANNFTLSEAEDNTSGPMNRGGIADLPLLRTLLAISQKPGQPSFWEVIDSFILVAYASYFCGGNFPTFLQEFILQTSEPHTFAVTFFLQKKILVLLFQILPTTDF